MGLGIFDAHGIGGDLGPAVEGSARKKQRVNDGQGKKVERGRGDDQENVDQRHGRHVNEVRNEDEIENQNKLGSSESNDDEESEADVTDDDRDTDEIDSDGSNDNSTDESEDSEASEDSDSSAEHDDNDDFDDDNIQHDNIFVTQKAQNRAHDIALHLPVTVSSQPLPISPVP